ncbi:MAG: VWA domain-containing protein, partial [Bacteroidales bacterium]|nr:VWA domain-containing protein [Bacteroidales bacterium]
VLLIDVSGSRFFGSTTRLKRDLMAEVAAVLSFSASINNDKVGALFFSSKVEKFIPPKKGRSHLLHIIRELVEFEPEEKGTDIAAALEFLTNAIKKKCTAFLLSDMIDVDAERNPRWEDAMKVAADRHDISVINIYDRRERELPPVGLINVLDAETGRQMWVDTSSKAMRDSYHKWNTEVQEKTKQVLRRYRVDSVDIATDQDYVKELISLFKHRA